MPLGPSMVLAFDDGSSLLDVVFWLVAGLFWIIAQVHAAKKKQEKKARAAQAPRPSAAAPGGGEAPAPDELAEIFRRLGADIPGTPPPASRPAPIPVPAPAALRRPSPPPAKKPAAARVHPELARRLANVRQEAERAAKRADAERLAASAAAPSVQSRAGEIPALDTATRHTGAILPRLYAMSMRLAPLPALPMPGLDRTHHAGKKWRPPLHSRREVREALIAQTFLQPAKAASR